MLNAFQMNNFAGRKLHLIAWNPTSAEDTFTCYKLQIDSVAGNFILTYKDGLVTHANFDEYKKNTVRSCLF